MIISNNQIQSLLNQYLKRDANFGPAKKEDLEKAGNQNGRKSSVSQDVRAYSVAKEVIKDLPDIREDRLVKIEIQVNSSTYEITDEEVAEKMIGRSLVDKLV